MDDKRFDEFIKAKLANYEEPGFDENALSALHTRLDATATTLPWYSRFRYELITLSGFAICTFIIVWFLRNDSQATKDAVKNYQSLIADQRQQLSNLQDALDQLSLAVPETVWVTGQQNQRNDETILLSRIAQLEQRIEEMNDTYSHENVSIVSGQVFAYDSSFTLDQVRIPNRLAVRDQETTSLHAIPRASLSSSNSTHEKKLSAKAIRDMERHYQRGIGIRLGPTVEVSKGFYSEADGAIDVGFGVLADLIVSPSLSLETGIKHVKRYYEIDELSTTDLPGVDQSLGEFDLAEIDTWNIEIPLNLKYRYPINPKTRWLTSIGYSAIINYRQVFEYSYRHLQGNGFTIGSTYENDKVEMYPGLFNIVVGLSHELRNKKTLEGSLYYQHGLGSTGIEGVTPRYFGLRAVYWFNVR